MPSLEVPWPDLPWGTHRTRAWPSGYCGEVVPYAGGGASGLRELNADQQDTLQLRRVKFRFYVGSTQSGKVYALRWVERFHPILPNVGDDIYQYRTVFFVGTGGAVSVGVPSDSTGGGAPYAALAGPDRGDDFTLDPPPYQQGNGSVTVELADYDLPNRFKIDLDIDADYDGAITEDDDPIETDPGGLVGVNDSMLNAIENRLVPIDLRIEPEEDLEGVAELHVHAPPNRIRLWTSPDMQTEATTLVWDLGNGDILPDVLYVEGLSVSPSPKDVALTLVYDEPNEDPPVEDRVVLTVARADLLLDINLDGTFDAADDTLEATAPGKVLNLAAGTREELHLSLLPHVWREPGTSLHLHASDPAILRVFDPSGTQIIGPETGDTWTKPVHEFDGYLWPASFAVEGAALGEATLTLTLTDGAGESVCRDMVQLAIRSVALNLMWETANKANQIYNPTMKDDPYAAHNTPEADGYLGVPRNILYIVSDAGDNQFKISLDLDIQPVGLRDRFICAAYETSKIAGSDTPVPSDPSAPVEMAFPASSAVVASTIEIKAGLDANDNGELDENEPMQIEVYKDPGDGSSRYATVRGSGSARYSDAFGHISGWIMLGKLLNGAGVPAAPHAVALLGIFRDGGLSTFPITLDAPTVTTSSIDAFQNANSTSSSFSEWLTHNSGAHFNDSGVASALPVYTWDATSGFAELLTRAKPINPIVIAPNERIWEFHTDVAQPAAVAYFLSNQAEQSVTVPTNGGFYVNPTGLPDEHSAYAQVTPSWVPPRTLLVWELAWLRVDDANGTFGRIRVPSISYQFDFIRVNVGGQDYARLISIRVVGSAQDLYDYNFEVPGKASDAATLQVGYGNGGNSRTAGQIFLTNVDFDETFDQILPSEFPDAPIQ